jgi:hypothetical protein
MEPRSLSKRDKRLLLGSKVTLFVVLALIWALLFSDLINSLAFILLWMAAFITWVLVRPLLPTEAAPAKPLVNETRAARKRELEVQERELRGQLAPIKNELRQIADEEYQEELRQDDWLTRNWLRSHERLARKNPALAYLLAVVVLVGLAYTTALAFGWSEFKW